MLMLQWMILSIRHQRILLSKIWIKLPNYCQLKFLVVQNWFNLKVISQLNRSRLKKVLLISHLMTLVVLRLMLEMMDLLQYLQQLQKYPLFKQLMKIRLLRQHLQQHLLLLQLVMTVIFLLLHWHNNKVSHYPKKKWQKFKLRQKHKHKLLQVVVLLQNQQDLNLQLQQLHL